MITIVIEPREMFDPTTGRFTQIPGATLTLEHSLISLKKWESKWHVPFLDKKDKTIDEITDYVRCMTLEKNVDPRVYSALSDKNIREIVSYIEDPMTATTFTSRVPPGTGGRKRERITNEIIYYWMITYGIPMECQKWHLNQLLTLIRVLSVKNSPKSKKSAHESKLEADYRSMINQQRREQYHTTG